MNYGETTCELYQADETTTLLSRAWLPDSEVTAIYIGIHGGMAHGGDWGTPAEYFKGKGIATYALDLRFHGTYPEYNPGGRNFFHIDSYDTYARDIHGYIGWVKEHHPGVPVFILSHSNGALIALYYGLTLGKEADIKGFILSSPWLKNKVAVPKVLYHASRVVAKVHPTFSVAPPALTHLLTHDAQITERHVDDEKRGLRSAKVSARLGVESEKTQQWVVSRMKTWDRFPIFCVIAGDDRLADPAVSQQAMADVPAGLADVITYEANYHENFNEVNREEIFDRILAWAGRYV
ncbi:alpha/beta fold hydrolase [Desulfoluna spongiiphila]|uniref:Lysophospholipase, alpha-beta hydrolase superfamily n=1 Tax=Desulfoluna spongiiphila TaxID=419481 RepID=A0A1G5E2Z3_9BACT|nr:alpha/beta fold hydrolase [Desulfoluna spongiiphila]SCY21225.1 Lysophospholipase, alpha-beta hydrolase superfamily [Desulfoluna spongiiphila]